MPRALPRLERPASTRFGGCLAWPGSVGGEAPAAWACRSRPHRGSGRSRRLRRRHERVPATWPRTSSGSVVTRAIGVRSTSGQVGRQRRAGRRRNDGVGERGRGGSRCRGTESGRSGRGRSRRAPRSSRRGATRVQRVVRARAAAAGIPHASSAPSVRTRARAAAGRMVARARAQTLGRLDRRRQTTRRTGAGRCRARRTRRTTSTPHDSSPPRGAGTPMRPRLYRPRQSGRTPETGAPPASERTSSGTETLSG